MSSLTDDLTNGIESMRVGTAALDVARKHLQGILCLEESVEMLARTVNHLQQEQRIVETYRRFIQDCNS